MEKSNREERMGKGRLSERIKRIAKYLVSALDRWNDAMVNALIKWNIAKRAEEADLHFTATEGFFDQLMGKDEEKDER